ncbi:hypothetical protein SARC_11090, partial [Sphaeroforma arctica JP610]
MMLNRIEGSGRHQKRERYHSRSHSRERGRDKKRGSRGGNRAYFESSESEEELYCTVCHDTNHTAEDCPRYGGFSRGGIEEEAASQVKWGGGPVVVGAVHTWRMQILVVHSTSLRIVGLISSVWRPET